jgi:hypothetical protein
MVVPVPTTSIAIALHMFNLALITEFERYILNISKAGYDYDLYIAVQKGSDYTTVKECWPEAIIIECENRGFDIGSFLISLVQILSKPYLYILKLHTKNHPDWRKALVAPILATPTRVAHAINLFRDPSIGMVGCERWAINIGQDFGHNRIHIATIAKTWNVRVQPCRFIGGTVFWVRASILREAVQQLDLSALAHSLNTIETLDWSWYLMTYPELRQEGVDTQLTAEDHWMKLGKGQGRACNCLYARVNQIGTPNCDGMHEHAYERFFGMLVSNAKQRLVGVGTRNLLEEHGIKVLATYHPQEVWHLPPGTVSPQSLYNSNDTETLRHQVLTMLKFGISGVCYRLTPETLDFIDHLYKEVPFCLSWAQGLAVNPSKLASILNHPNYIRVKNKPLLVTPNGVGVTGFEIMAPSLTIPTIHDKSRSLGKELYQVLVEVVKVPQYLIIDSWNDWHRQIALEPSQAFGYKSLQEFRNTFKYFD